MDFSNLGAFDREQLRTANATVYNFVAGYLAAQNTDFEDEDAVNDALSILFKGASEQKESMLEAFGEEVEPESDDEAAAA